MAAENGLDIQDKGYSLVEAVVADWGRASHMDIAAEALLMTYLIPARRQVL